MKKHLALFLLLILFSACSINKNQPINDYMIQYVLNDTVNDSFYNNKIRDTFVWIGQNKLSKKDALKALNNTSHYNKNNGKWDLKFNQTALYNEKAWKKLVNKNVGKSSPDYWKSNDFSFKNRVFSKQEIDSVRKLADYSLREKVYFFTDVMYYDKDIAVFRLEEVTNQFNGGLFKDHILFMKKENGKWIVIDEGIINRY
ncbi:hypothetical protein GN157_05130 [Flavobacterium rakeshii]|uniref:DUF4829 domain-containing protein n=1 Tax=Flavobacterium rakeshii TaxID=1038845 RepID=A0A6N8HE82_9FLAO|nr:hypothetical protein [Flavobacterium rakeshii]MUV03087.1 hypothetical protein [Flavobacterium rakeshii]